MSHTTFAVDETAELLPLPVLLDACAKLKVTVQPDPETSGALYAEPADALTAELLDALREYKPDLLAFFTLRADILKAFSDAQLLQENERTAKADRATCLAFLRRRLVTLADRLGASPLAVFDDAGQVTGWHDPADPFEPVDYLTALRALIAALPKTLPANAPL